MFWLSNETIQPDTHAAFRVHFELPHATRVELRLLGASWYHAWLDGAFLTEGPPRFPLDHPEYEHHTLELAAGPHVLALHVHYEGLETRLMPDVQPFAWAEVRATEAPAPLPLRWSCAPLPGYRPRTGRINAQLGWVEWCDTRQNPDGWQQPDFDDGAWAAPAPVERPIGAPRPLRMANIQQLPVALQCIGVGPLAHFFGYEFDDIAARFYLRDLACHSLPPRGLWRRYDLGRVRLARPRFTLDVPAGTQIEFAASEYLFEGRVTPWISLAGGGANLDHYVARGGPQTFEPLTPKGGRFLEMHVLLPAGHAPAEAKILEAGAIERAYYAEPSGSFACDDPLLGRIWSTGVETLRACVEDAIIDNPTRERGQWTGDVPVGQQIASYAYNDLGVLRRALVQAAQCAREDGMVAGLGPGNVTFLNTYALQWVRSCVTYFEQTGERALLEELYDAAWRNFAAFESFMSAAGLVERTSPEQAELGWTFIDWGYGWQDGPSDMALNLHALASHHALAHWSTLLDQPADAARATAAAERLRGIVAGWLERQLAPGGGGWPAIGYHVAALALGEGFFAAGGSQEGEAIACLKTHLLSCFPNDPTAPRNDYPFTANPRVITPYFAHYAFPALIERGEMDFVLGQYRHCWGEYGLAEGRTTWVEVFETRWSHCHQWSGCPTWQLSRYALGLRPRHDLAPGTWELDPHPGSLHGASGSVPWPGSDATLEVRWQREGAVARYTIESAEPFTLRLPDGKSVQGQGTLHVEIPLAAEPEPALGPA